MLQTFRENPRKSEDLEISFEARRRLQVEDRRPRVAYKTRTRQEPGDSIVRLCRIRRRLQLIFSQVSIFLRTTFTAVIVPQQRTEYSYRAYVLYRFRPLDDVALCPEPPSRLHDYSCAMCWKLLGGSFLVRWFPPPSSYQCPKPQFCGRFSIVAKGPAQ